MICTHNGKFHADEALACFMLKQLPQFENLPIVRTRDMAVIATATVVVDVGGVYDFDSLRFDHHQRDFTETLLDYGIKLSSAGLVYRHFGRAVLQKLFGIKDDVLEQVYLKIYDEYVKSYDAVDNGVNQYDEQCKPKYQTISDVFCRVNRLNPAWNSENSNPDAEFMRAVALVGNDMVEHCSFIVNAWLPARQIVIDALDNAPEHDDQSRILVLKTNCPWRDHLFQIEEQRNIIGRTIYVIYEDSTSHDYRIQCVPESQNSFGNRLSLKEEWRGLRDDALSACAVVSGCVFVHASGFIGGNKTLEGALQMAKLSLNQ